MTWAMIIFGAIVIVMLIPSPRPYPNESRRRRNSQTLKEKLDEIHRAVIPRDDGAIRKE